MDEKMKLLDMQFHAVREKLADTVKMLNNQIDKIEKDKEIQYQKMDQAVIFTRQQIHFDEKKKLFTNSEHTDYTTIDLNAMESKVFDIIWARIKNRQIDINIASSIREASRQVIEECIENDPKFNLDRDYVG